MRLCPALESTRIFLYDFTVRFSNSLPDSVKILLSSKCHPTAPSFIQFILDCSADSDVISLCQDVGFNILDPLFDVTRTWAYVIHRERLKLLGHWRLGDY